MADSGYFSLASASYNGNARPFHDYADTLATGHYDSRVADLRGNLNSSLYAPQTVRTEGGLPTALISTGGGRTDELLRVYPPSKHLSGAPIEYLPGNLGPRPATYPYQPIETRQATIFPGYGQNLLTSGTPYASRRYIDNGPEISTRAAPPPTTVGRYAGPYTAAQATGGTVLTGDSPRKVTLASFANSRAFGGYSGYTATNSPGRVSEGYLTNANAYSSMAGQPYIRQYAAPAETSLVSSYYNPASYAERLLSGNNLRSSGYTLPATSYGYGSYSPERRVIPLSASFRPPASLSAVPSALASTPGIMSRGVAEPSVYRSQPASRPLAADESYA